MRFDHFSSEFTYYYFAMLLTFFSVSLALSQLKAGVGNDNMLDVVQVDGRLTKIPIAQNKFETADRPSFYRDTIRYAYAHYKIRMILVILTIFLPILFYVLTLSNHTHTHTHANIKY